MNFPAREGKKEGSIRVVMEVRLRNVRCRESDRSCKETRWNEGRERRVQG